MSWRDTIAAGGSTQRAYLEYADERIASLTKVCISLASTFEEIRAAQAGIAEMTKLRNLPDTMKREAQARGN